MRNAQARTWASVALLGALAVSCARPATVPAGPAAAARIGPSTQALTSGFTLSCAPGQRAVIGQVVSAGQPITDVRCVVDVPAPGALAVAAYDQPDAGAQARPRPGVRTVAYRTDGDLLTYEPRSVRRARPRRTWQKSVVIIGSSAGVGAGVGAAIGGKKGALIGAAIGGGSATIWDQATRRR